MSLSSAQLLPLANASVLVTGGLGFIGSQLAIALVNAGAEVTVLDADVEHTGANAFNLATVRDRVRLLRGDIRDAEALRACIEGRDYLFNMAGLSSHLESLRNPLEDLDVNYRAQLGITDTCLAAAPAIRIVHASTRQVYGRAESLPVAETHAIHPPDPNGINKYAAERHYELAARLRDLHVTSLRMTNTYGPHMRVRDARQTFLGLWIARAVAGTGFEVWGGEQVRDFTFVDDLVDACLLCALGDHAGRVFNVGGAVTTLRDAADALVKTVDHGSYSVCDFPAERKAIDIGDYVADDTALRQATGWMPTTSLVDGLERTVHFYREHIARYV